MFVTGLRHTVQHGEQKERKRANLSCSKKQERSRDGQSDG